MFTRDKVKATIEEIEKLEKELKIIDEKVEDESRKIIDLRLQISNIEESIWDLRNKRAGIRQEITKLKNKNRKKYGVIINDYSKDIIEEFETLKECYDYIDKAIVKKRIKSIRIDKNPDREA